MGRKNERMDQAISTVKRRAEIFCCSYKTAWINYMDEEEKEGFTFGQVAAQITGGLP